jgi:hypothetical protein
VLVLSPFGGRSRHPLEWGMQLAAQVDELRARGSSVETIFPDGNSEHMFGANAMDLSLRPPPLELVTTRAEPLPSSSPNSGANTQETSRLGRHDDTCSCLGWPMGATCLTRPSCALTWARSAGLTNLPAGRGSTA